MLTLLFESVKIAVDSILSNKIRSFLTGLSIIIGILTVTLMGTLISGLDRGFEKSMDFLGKDVGGGSQQHADRRARVLG